MNLSDIDVTLEVTLTILSYHDCCLLVVNITIFSRILNRLNPLAATTRATITTLIRDLLESCKLILSATNEREIFWRQRSVSNLFLNIRNVPWLISIIHAGRWLSIQKNILTLNTGRGYSTLKAKLSLWTDFIKEKPNQLLASHLFKFTWEVHGLQMSCTSCKVHSRFALCAIRNVKEKDWEMWLLTRCLMCDIHGNQVLLG